MKSTGWTWLTLIFAGIFAMMARGCASAPEKISLAEPAVYPGGFQREGHPNFSKKEGELIAAARKELEETDKKPEDVFYRVRKTDGGYEVFILYVTGYEEKRPLFRPCNDAAVLLDRAGNVREVLTGPAAWP